MQNHAMQTMQSCANANRLDFDGIAEDILKDQPGEFTHFYTAPFIENFSKLSDMLYRSIRLLLKVF